jgi:hypothetical protein
MGSGDLFKRQSLLPRTVRSSLPVQRNPTLPPGEPGTDSSTEDAGKAVARREDPARASVFERETIIPAISPELMARASMKSSADNSFDIEVADPCNDRASSSAGDPPEPPGLYPLTESSLPPMSGREVGVDVDAVMSQFTDAATSSERTPERARESELCLDFAQDDALAYVNHHRRRASSSARIPAAADLGRGSDIPEALPPQASALPPPQDAGLPFDPADGEATPQVTSLSDLYAVGDYTGALEEAERRLRNDANNALAARYAERCRQVLTTMYEARLGDMSGTVRMLLEPGQLRWLSIDHRSGFMLSLIDRPITVEELLDLAGMPRLDAMRVVLDLLDKEIIQLSS